MKTMADVRSAARRLPKILDQIHWDLARIPNPSNQQIRTAQAQERRVLIVAAELSASLHKHRLGREWTRNGNPPPPTAPIPEEVAQKILF